ncbi:MAG TPA: hypothetical protein VGI79_03460 [Caulobacteraceae bacterium]|jgi:hypothetical protein
MSSFRGVVRAGLIGAGAVALATAAQAAPAAPATQGHLDKCFYLSDWQGWSSPSPNVLYLRVRMHDIYRVDLSAGSSLLQAPAVHLVNKVRGSDSVCWPIDLDLSVSDGMGMRMPLIASSITKLSTEEIAAIPKKYQP